MIPRLPADSVDELFHRYGCIRVDHDPSSLASASPYDAILIAPGVEVPVGPSLSDAFKTVRGGFELEDIFVRPVGATRFEPCLGHHIPTSGEWAIVARHRHPTHDPRIVGIMLAKDESDIVGEVLASLRPVLDKLCVWASDPETQNAIAAFGQPDWVHMIAPANQLTPADGFRQTLLTTARGNRGDDPRPTWVMVVQGDEIYADDLKHHIRLAQQARATVMTCQVATFLIHESQRASWDWNLPIAQRLTHYIWDFGEHTGFLDFPWVYYDPREHMRAFPHGIYPAIYAPARPVRKHYPFRNPEQAAKRVADRIASGWQPHYTNYEAIFMGDNAAGRPMKKFHGWFPEAERVEGIW